ncbi:MAG: hypothetical protein JKY37_33075 [Nannocystaceae bacterium]|nr:hypothetical protein [Nannocystaceae bacterium]
MDPSLGNEAAASLDAADRQRLHEITLNALPEDEHEGRVVHLAALGWLAEATVAATHIAQRAEGRAAFGFAAKWYQRAIEWAPDAGDSDELKWRLAVALEGEGRLPDAAARYAPLGSRGAFAAARCWFDGGRVDEALVQIREPLREVNLSTTGSRPLMVMQLLGNLARLLVRRRLEIAEDSPRSASRAELAWLLARGLMMTDAPRSLLMSLRAVREGLAGGSPLVTGRALAFVGGGVFLQLPFFRRSSQRWLDQVHKWAQRHPILEVSARVWEGVASVSRGAWSRSRQTLEAVEEELRLHPT